MRDSRIDLPTFCAPLAGATPGGARTRPKYAPDDRVVGKETTAVIGEGRP